jgi:sugar phosphate isomerase/epimerase
MSSASSSLPVIGAALLVDDLERHHNWIIEGKRDLELQDFDVVGVLEDNAWQPIVDRARRWLDGYEGRLGIHGPFRDVPLACTDPAVRRIVDYRMNQALDICEALGATNVVIHSPFTIWDYDSFDHFPGARERLVERVHKTMGNVVRRAESMGCTFVIETIEDRDPRSWVELARSFNSPAMALSIDTGHTYYCHCSHRAPPIDYFIAAAGRDLQHMHIQDADGHADRHWRPGKGTINWVAIFDALQLSGANPRLIIELDTPNRHEVRMGADWLIERGLAR